MATLRLGVDVGGTFTDVVAVDAVTRALVARVKIPTTHDAPGGVAEGIIAGIECLMREHAIAPADVAFIAHSTTQATNALLEGDVARVGVLGLVPRGAGWLTRRHLRFAPIELAPGRMFAPVFTFARANGERSLEPAFDELRRAGVDAVAVSEPFAVDDPARERTAVASARERGFAATSGHDVTAMYGLRARTRTAALNAAILPTMVRTAEMTRDAVRRAAIAAPLMVMRSDGGVMSVDEVQTRPILTMLSGPAAGVAGALLYENVTDGIFLEVGGTSVDCSAIKAGKPQMRPARIGGFRTMLTTIDSRTLGIAGGSVPRIDARGIHDVGPRSAHIAGCRYASFCTESELRGARVERFVPKDGDPGDYVRLRLTDGSLATLTPTCAANALDLVPSGAFARGDRDAAMAAFELLANELHGDARALATRMLELAAEKVRPTIDALIADYELPRERIVLVGGGGGAASIVPFIARALGFEHRLAKDAEVISPIGVALALVRDVVERTIVDPQPAEIAAIRREAYEKAVAAGAAPEAVEVSVEIDRQRSRVRATASGAAAIALESATPNATDAERAAAAARSLTSAPSDLAHIATVASFAIYSARELTAIVDERAVVRLVVERAVVTQATSATCAQTLERIIEETTRFGDVGRELPAIYLLSRGRMLDVRGYARASEAVALVTEELRGYEDDEELAVIAA